MDELGRVGWLTVGVAGMALAGTARAVSQAGRIARGLLQSPPAQADGTPAAGGPDAQADGGPGGWILLAALLLAAGAAYHAVTGAEAVVKEILHGPAR
ncbi:hypothetical protein [Kitasatospora arboriphila]|uniref:DUF4235 domain-containing protein n=1 Tax=Kitasatospora arboriphila TaxID=258052 RepID=A0ABN1TDL6_9ACTN